MRVISNKLKAAPKNRAFNESELKKMSEDKRLNFKHMIHKPYKCDFGGN